MLVFRARIHSQVSPVDFSCVPLLMTRDNPVLHIHVTQSGMYNTRPAHRFPDSQVSDEILVYVCSSEGVKLFSDNCFNHPCMQAVLVWGGFEIVHDFRLWTQMEWPLVRWVGVKSLHS